MLREKARDGLESINRTTATERVPFASGCLSLQLCCLSISRDSLLVIKVGEHLRKQISNNNNKKNLMFNKRCAWILGEQENHHPWQEKSISAPGLTWEATCVSPFNELEVIARCLEGGVTYAAALPTGRCCVPSCCLLRRPKRQEGKRKRKVIAFSSSWFPTPGKRRIWKQHWERGPTKHWHDQKGGSNSWVLVF